MKVKVGGVGYSWFEVESNNKYAKVIADGLYKGLYNFTQYAKYEDSNVDVRLIRDLTPDKLNKYIIKVFSALEKEVDNNFFICNKLKMLFGSLNELNESQIKMFSMNITDNDRIDIIASYMYDLIKNKSEKYHVKLEELAKEIINE